MLIAALAGYNFLVGDLVAEHGVQRGETVVLFAVVMAMHFVGLNHLYRKDFTRLFDGILRYLCVAALYLGWLTSFATPVQPEILALGSSFLAGAIIVVTAVGELPYVKSQRQFAAFCLGAVLIMVLLLILEFAGY